MTVGVSDTPTERRGFFRYPISCRIDMSSLSEATGGAMRSGDLAGAVVNVSDGGSCILADQPLEPLTVLRCQFRFPGVPVPIPVLSQVRWVERFHGDHRAFRIGLAFII
jgi:hypothetical protein